MNTINLTLDEVRFMDQYVRELHMGAGVATEQLHQSGIFMDPDLFAPLTYFWDQSWRSRDQEFPYPRQDDFEVICPWESKEVFEVRVKELKGLMNTLK